MSDKWKITGTFFEACNCDVACPCTFLSAPTNGQCTAFSGWHIDDGKYGDVSLNGLNVVLTLHAPGHMLEGKWQAALYIDEKASEDQKSKLTKIFSGQAGGHPAMLGSFISEVLGIKSVAINFKSNGKQRSLVIENIIDVEIEAIQDQGGQEVTITNAPMGIAPGYPIVVAKSNKFNYKDHGLQWEISGKNGFYSPFAYQAD